MSRTALIYRVDQLPSVFVPRSLYITKVNGESHYDLFLSTSDGLNIERIITDSDVVPMFNAQSNKANGVLQLDSNGMVPVDRVPNIPADKILSSLTVDTSGNSASATKLKTARSINGVAFDGTANITINAVDSTARIASSEKGVANGVATLGDDGKVPSSQLPSFVDDILEFTNLASFPATGESGKIYLALDSNKIYRWSGSTYIDVNSSVSSADTAVKLATARTISVTGDASLSFSFDGSQDISSSLTLANSGVTAGEYPVTTVNAKGLVVGGRTLTQADIPPLSGSKIINTLLVDTLGNAGTATRLQTARLINGVAFDGTADISISAVDSTPRVPWSSVGAPNGVPSLDASGAKVIQIASRVDGQDTSLKTYDDKFVWDVIKAPFAIRAVSGSGNNPSFNTVFGNMQGLIFSSSSMQQVWIDFEIPHSYALGTELLYKVHWCPINNSGGTVAWGVEYSIAKRDEVFPSSTTTLIMLHTVASNSPRKHMTTEIPIGSGIPGTDIEPGTVIKMRVFRDATNSLDTLNANVHAWAASLHYQVGQIGTRSHLPNHFA